MASKVAPLLIAFAAFFTPEIASAVPDYPAALREATGAACVLPCTLCHRDNNGGIGTVIKPFGNAMIEHGLNREDTDLIAVAVKAMKAGDCALGSPDAGGQSDAGTEAGAPDSGGLCPNGLPPTPVDSDNDGVSDIDELVAGTDPNIKGDVPVCPPSYGCGARVEPDGKLDFGAALLALGAAAALVWSWRRPPR